MSYSSHRIARFTGGLSILALALSSQIASAQTAPGGLLQNGAEASVQAKLSASAIRGFLPEKGPFTFPAPWNTQGVRLTNAADCGGGDCVNAVGYSYWNNINYHVGSDTMLIVLGMDKRSGGQGPTLLQYNKVTE